MSNPSFYESKIFLKKSKAKGGADGLNLIPPESAFKHDRFDLGKIDTKEVKKSGWITVVGIINQQNINIIRRKFEKYGKILKLETTIGNWCYIEFEDSGVITSIIKECENGPIIVDNMYLVVCERGKLLPKYVSQAPKKEEKLPYQRDVTLNVEPKQKESISARIFDRIMSIF